MLLYLTAGTKSAPILVAIPYTRIVSIREVKTTLTEVPKTRPMHFEAAGNDFYERKEPDGTSTFWIEPKEEDTSYPMDDGEAGYEEAWRFRVETLAARRSKEEDEAKNCLVVTDDGAVHYVQETFETVTKRIIEIHVTVLGR